MTSDEVPTGRRTIPGARIERYTTILREKSRPPSRGGNTKALHVHVLTIGGQTYSFLALGSQQWVYKTDTVSFDYEIKDGKYRNVVKETIRVLDKNGNPVTRGNRGFKKTLRTATTRAPVSRREWRD
jgi:hypothetical protein